METNIKIPRKMTGHKFEYICAEILKKRGFKKVQVTSGSGDQGADIIAKKGRHRYAIQCKLYSKPVGNKAVQEAYSAMAYYGCDKGAVMTNSTFTSGAVNLANKTGVELWEKTPLRAPSTTIGTIVGTTLVLVVLLMFTESRELKILEIYMFIMIEVIYILRKPLSFFLGLFIKNNDGKIVLTDEIDSNIEEIGNPQDVTCGEEDCINYAYEIESMDTQSDISEIDM